MRCFGNNNMISTQKVYFLNVVVPSVYKVCTVGFSVHFKNGDGCIIDFKISF